MFLRAWRGRESDEVVRACPPSFLSERVAGTMEVLTSWSMFNSDWRRNGELHGVMLLFAIRPRSVMASLDLSWAVPVCHIDNCRTIRTIKTAKSPKFESLQAGSEPEAHH